MTTDTPQGTGTESASLSDAASRIAGLLTPATDNSTESEDSQAEQAEPTQSEDEGAAPSETEPSGEDATDQEAEEQPQPKKFKVGDAEVDEAELIKGYLRQSDYTKKTMEAAAERKAAQAEAKAVSEERAKYAQTLEYLAQQIPQPKQPDAALLETDPVEYLKQRDAFERAAMQRHQIEQEHRRVTQQMEAEARQRHEEIRAIEAQALVEKLPEWQDEAKAAAGKKEVATYLLASGYKPEEISGLVDHRSVVIARKAMLYDKLQAAKPAVENKVREAPPVLKPMAKNTVTQANRVDAAKAQLRKTGHVKDAASAILALQGFKR